MIFFKRFVLSTVLALVVNTVNVAQDIEEQKQHLVEKVQELKEFKKAFNQIDSLKRKGHPIDFYFEIV